MKKLRLSAEALTELAGFELEAVAGGTHLGCGATDTCTHNTCPVIARTLQLDCFSLDPRICLGFTTPVNCLTNNCT